MHYQDDTEQAKSAFSALFGASSQSGLGARSTAAEDDDTLDEQGVGAMRPGMNRPMSDDEQDNSFDDLASGANGYAGEAEGGLAGEAEGADADESGDVGADGVVGGSLGRLRAAKRLSPGALVVYLLKGYVDREDSPVVYDSIVQQQPAVSELCMKLFLRLIVDDAAGYAYLKSLDDEDIPVVSGLRPPRLLVKRQLSFFSSFILIILRQRLLEFELSGQFGRLVLERQSIVDQVKAYIHNVNNETKFDDRLNKAIDDLCEMGVLKASTIESGKTVIERIEVKRIINAIVTPEVLNQADEILTSYVQYLKDGARGKNRDL